MRHLRIFLLHLQYAFELRSRSFVWFLISFINASIYLLFWQGALRTGNVIVEGLSLSGITSYYLLLIIAGAFLTVHIDEDIALGDIKQGYLVKYLTRPFSYFWIKFIEEIPYRETRNYLKLILRNYTNHLLIYEEKFQPFPLSNNPLSDVQEINKN